MKYAVCVAWHDEKQKERFLSSWSVDSIPDWLFMEQDKDHSGCAKTKNRAILRALEAKPEFICVIDDDISPSNDTTDTLQKWAEQHALCYHFPERVRVFEAVTEPPSRGTPYLPQNHFLELPVAAVMGFWVGVGDYCAAAQLVRGATTPMKFRKEAFFWRWFPLSGMNVSFRSELWPHFKFDEEHDRWDDIFSGYRLMAEAYRRGYCITTKGPTVRHSRQSDPFKNLKIEAEHAERNETLWRQYV